MAGTIEKPLFKLFNCNLNFKQVCVVSHEYGAI